MEIKQPSDLSHKQFVHYQGTKCVCVFVQVRLSLHLPCPAGVDSPGSTIIKAQGYGDNTQVSLASPPLKEEPHLEHSMRGTAKAIPALRHLEVSFP